MENLTEYLETYHEIAIAIEEEYNKLEVFEEDPFDGKGGRWEKAKEWADEFTELHKNNDWVDDEWFDAVAEFVKEKVSILKGEN